MMKKYLFPSLAFLLLLTVCSSCVRDVVMDAREKPQVVVACILTDEAEQRLLLSFSKGASAAEAPQLTEANAMLFDKDGMVGQFKRGQGDEWTLSYKAIPGEHYRLEIEVPGYNLITAEQTMPKPAKVYSHGYYHYGRMIEGLNWPTGQGIWPPIVPNAEDFEWLPLGTKSYYLFDIPDPIWVYAMDYYPETGVHRLAETICSECPFVDSFNTTGETYVPAQRTDIPNPYVEGSHVAQLAPKLEGVSLHKQFLRFPVKNLSDFNGWWFMIAGSMQGKYNCKDFYRSYYYGDMGLADPLLPDEGYLVFTAVSEDLDAYLRDAHYRILLQESSDLTTIYLRDNSFTNINGGLGIFGAKCSRKYQWSGEYDYVDDGQTHYFPSGPASSNDNYYNQVDWSFLE